MKMLIVSQFKDRPKFKITWWAMGLGLTIIIAIPLVVVLALSAGTLFGLIWALSFLPLSIFSISAIATGAVSLHKGERSWVLWLGWIPALITGVFWLLIMVIFPIFGFERFGL